MPWMALDTGFGTFYAGAHDPKAQPKRLRMRWTPNENRAEIAFDHRLFLAAGKSWEIPETVCEKTEGDWHAAAKRYRKWYDTVREVRAATPAWTQEVAGWLLVIMRQQNEALFWKYTDIPKLCDVCEKNGLDCIGLFGWTGPEAGNRSWYSALPQHHPYPLRKWGKRYGCCRRSFFPIPPDHQKETASPFPCGGCRFLLWKYR